MTITESAVIYDFMEDHADLILGIAAFCVFMAIDSFAEIRAWHKGMKQLKASEAIGG